MREGTLPLALDIRIHLQPLHNQNPAFLLRAEQRRIPTRLVCYTPEQRTLFDLGAEKTATTSEPEKNEVEFRAREELHGDVKEACIAGAEGEGFGGEAVFRDVGEGGGENCCLAVVVFVVWQAGVEG